MNNFEKLNRLVKKYNLQHLGFLNLSPSEIRKTGVKSLVLLGPDEPKFWDSFSCSPEKIDNSPHPLDRWSKRVLTDIAIELTAKVFFPFDGPPYWPFYNWALRSGDSFQSPIKLLVHKRIGLFVSFRGAIGFQQKITETSFERKVSPCETCKKPCISACPARALTVATYDDASCRDFVIRSDEDSCSSGCLVRRSCPIGKGLRATEQSKFHMSYFIKN